MSATISIDGLKPEISFTSDLLLDKTFVIIPATVELSESIIKALKFWEFKTLNHDGSVSLGEMNNDGTENSSAEPDHPSLAHATQNLAKTFEESEKLHENSEKARYDSVQKVYEEYMKYINSVYTHYATHKTLNLQEMEQTVQKLCIFIKENKRYVLRISPSAEARNKNFLVAHSMRTTVLAITIALELHLPLSNIVELGVTTILHEIGMLRLPPQLYLTNRTLSQSEKKQISMHPILGCNILKELGFPNSILMGVLDHHEKENGFGYPRGLTGDKISPYGKIISVACSFEAITAPRTYKSEHTTYEAMVEMLKNLNRQYDPTIIKALLSSLSLYPIGVYVYLNNGKIAVVSDVTPNRPQNPIVQLVNEKENDGSPKTVQTDDGANKIVRVLSKEETEEIVKEIKIQEAVEEEIRQEKLAAAKEAHGQAEQKEPESKDGFSNVDLSEFA